MKISLINYLNRSISILLAYHYTLSRFKLLKGIFPDSLYITTNIIFKK